MTQLTIIQPDDWHLHFRDGFMLQETVPATARCFRRAIVMPNLVPPVTNVQDALAYKERILAVSPNTEFEPLMTLYLTEQTQPKDIEDAKNAGVVAAKLYPAGATTNSASGVTDVKNIYPVLETMAKVGMLLLVHGEVTDGDIDIFDREAEFIERHLVGVVRDFPELKVVMEHITTKDAVDFVKAGGANLAATVTPQHLLLNRNDLLVGGIKPHNYCLPVLKRNTHQHALRAAVTEKQTKFFLGTDSAPHAKAMKETACGCAGCYSAWSALELYAQVFDEMNAIDKLEAFASLNGADFYGLPRNTNTVTLEKSDWTIPEVISLPNGEDIVPFFAGQTVSWKVATQSE